MEGVGQVVQDFLQERRRIIPVTVADPGARVGFVGTSGSVAAPEMDMDIRPGYADSESRFGFVVKEIGAGSSWDETLQSAAGVNDTLLATSLNAGSGALTMKIIDVDPVLFAPPGPGTLVGFTATVWASSPAFSADIRAQLHDGSDVALGALKTIGIQGEGELWEYTFGGAADLWGTAMTIAELRADGVKLAAWWHVNDLSATNVSIDAFLLTAHYTFDA